MEKENGGLMVDTPTTDVASENTENNNAVETPTTENGAKSFTQEQVNEFVKNRLERDRNSFYKRYGVKDRNGLDDLINKANSYSMMEERYNAMQDESANLKQELLLLKGNVNTDRYDDVRTYFKGKGLDFNESNLKAESKIKKHRRFLKKLTLRA